MPRTNAYHTILTRHSVHLRSPLTSHPSVLSSGRRQFSARPSPLTRLIQLSSLCASRPLISHTTYPPTQTQDWVPRYAPDPDSDLAPISTSVSSLLFPVLPLSFPLCNHCITGRGRLAAMTHQPPHYMHHTHDHLRHPRRIPSLCRPNQVPPLSAHPRTHLGLLMEARRHHRCT